MKVARAANGFADAAVHAKKPNEIVTVIGRQ